MADDLPFGGGHRLHRQPGMFDERHLLEARLRLHGCERHRLGQRLDRLHVDRQKLSLRVGRVHIGFADDVDDADDLLLVAGVIEEGQVALLHLLDIAARDEVAHPAPRLALGAALELIVPGEGLGFGLQQPVGHVFNPRRPRASGDPYAAACREGTDYRSPLARGRGLSKHPRPSPRQSYHASALSGRVNRFSIASSTLMRPSRMAATAVAIGMSTAFWSAISTSAAAVNWPSASMPALACAGLAPSPSAMPSEKLRDCRLAQDRMRSPRPERPVKDSGCAPNALPNRNSSAKPRVVSAAAALAPRPRPVTMPDAIASTFLAAPPISTPRTSTEW